MFEVKIEGIDELLAKLGKYAVQIDGLHKAMPDELVAWQRGDMRRKYPNMPVDSQDTSTAATTLIWPHSRTEDRTKRGPRRPGPKQHLPAKRGPVVRSTRSILRVELLERLSDRMHKLVAGAMQWP